MPRYIATITVKLEGDDFSAALQLAREVAGGINNDACTTCAAVVNVVREEESRDSGVDICTSPGCNQVLNPLRFWGANPPDRCSTCA
ncbi:hypothetical protein LCGC14_1041210 [marine sediment metagenome]|uniref:Uncharacterized protein n=1 Tax=marine sediment metagenome TaxID=412755 RepID=A0A0F9QXV4_9ZZZZ